MVSNVNLRTLLPLGLPHVDEAMYSISAKVKADISLTKADGFSLNSAELDLKIVVTYEESLVVKASANMKYPCVDTIEFSLDWMELNLTGVSFEKLTGKGYINCNALETGMFGSIQGELTNMYVSFNTDNQARRRCKLVVDPGLQ